MKTPIKTYFAPAERADESAIEKQSKFVSDFQYFDDLFGAVSDIVLILNKERQIVFYNQNLAKKPDIDQNIAQQKASLCGLRMGEALKCIHAFESEGGCGTTKFCRECGGINAILSSQKGVPAVEECRIIQKDTSNALDLKIKTRQITIGDQEFTIAAASDISDEKRRRVLERLFFHDIMNTAVGVRGLSELMSLAEEDQLKELREMIYSGSEKLVDEIKSQRMLTAAEKNELAITPVIIQSMKLLKEIDNLYQKHEVAEGKHLKISPDSADIEFKTDKAILSRVFGNMTKNALEACNAGDTVTIGCSVKAPAATINGSLEDVNTASSLKGFVEDGNWVTFWVHNPAVMPSHIQHQVFQRSFSTKGQGRGLGTYSMKLLSEQYLKGRVWFTSSEGETSSEDEGTTFFASYPQTIL